MAIALGAAGGWWSHGQWDSSSRDSSAPTLTTDVVRVGDLGATVLATGVVRPQVGAEVEVGSRVSGVLQSLHVDLGDEVEAGQLLAVLDPTEFRARVNEAEAGVASAQAEAEYARATFQRAEVLRRDGFISDEEFEAARRARDVASARLAQAGAAVEAARIQLSYTRIRAPISGVVASVSTQVGETVAASLAAPTFVTIIDLSALEVWAFVDETDIGRVQVGQEADFTVDTYPSIDFPGTVTAIRPSAELQGNVVNYVTVVDIADQRGRTLRPEMTTTVNIRLPARSGVLTVPNAAVRRDPAGTHVLVATGGGPLRQDIETGYRGVRRTEVLNGLEEGARVIIGSSVAESAPVRPHNTVSQP